MTEGGESKAGWRLYSLIGLMTLLWSLNYIVAKYALREFPALLAFGMRTALAGLLILPIYAWNGGKALPLRDALRIGLLGFVGVVLNQMFFILGLSRTSVAHAAIIIGVSPLLVLLIAWAAGQEKIGAVALTGMLIALTGIGVLQVGAGVPKLSSFVGDLMIFIAALTFAIFTVRSKELRKSYDGLTLNTYAYVSGGLILLPPTLWQAAAFPLRQASWLAWASVVFMAVFPSVICYMIFFYALRFVPASRVAAFSYLQPLLAILLAIPLLNEFPVGSLLLGGALVLAGVFITERA